MSQTQVAFLNKGSVPSRVVWESTVKSFGFDFTIDEEYQPFSDSGFLPCRLNGQLTGFELYFDTADSILGEFPHLKELIGQRDCVLLFNWSSKWLECASVHLACAALLKECDAVIHYQDDDILFASVDDLLEEAQEAIKYATSESPQEQLDSPRLKKPWWKLW